MEQIRHDDREHEILTKALKSRAKSLDSEQLKLKERAKEVCMICTLFQAFYFYKQKGNALQR